MAIQHNRGCCHEDYMMTAITAGNDDDGDADKEQQLGLKIKIGVPVGGEYTGTTSDLAGQLICPYLTDFGKVVFYYLLHYMYLSYLAAIKQALERL